MLGATAKEQAFTEEGVCHTSVLAVELVFERPMRDGIMQYACFNVTAIPHIISDSLEH